MNPEARVLFLDIDGVLNTERTRAFPGRPDPLDAEAVKNLNAITDALGAKIVVSSTWRIGSEEAFQRDVVDYLRNQGVTAEILGRTPSGVPDGPCTMCHSKGGKHRFSCRALDRGYRGAEINWKMGQMGLKPEQIIILDDDADMEPLMDRFVQIFFVTGISEADVKTVLGKFNLN